jgi:hypothetical protein
MFRLNTKLQHHFLSLAVFLCVSFQLVAQKTDPDTINYKSRKIKLGIITTVGLGASYYGLNNLWYSDYPRSPLHSFNDNGEWLQMDKAGHFASSYHLGKIGFESFQYCGFNYNTSLFLGGSAGLIFLTGIEILDGTSSQWGFSWGDEIANSSGTILFMLQEKFWKEQRITMKFSFTNSGYAMFNSDQLGRNFQQRLLKDYNGQTYWASYNISSFLASDAAFPKWMNIAIGYGATEMTSAKNYVNSVNNFQRTREFYLSFDADLNKIRWPRKWMKTTARILSFIKIPSPTFEMRSDGKVKMHALFF